MRSRTTTLLLTLLLAVSLLTACERFPETAVAPAAAPVVQQKAATLTSQPAPTPRAKATLPCAETSQEETGQCTGEAPTPTSMPLVLPTPAAANLVDVGELRTIQVYKDVGPSVVNITTRVVEFSFFYGPVPAEGAGSGFLWDREGHIVTNYHVIKDAQSIEVSFSADQVMPADVVGADPLNDLAVLKVEQVPDGLLPLSERLGDSDKLQVGQRAIAIGNPFGRFDRTLTAGVVSALGRTIETNEGGRLRKAIQTDAAINRGNSGGPLLDGNGYLIGVNSAIFSPTGTSAGIGFAIPVNTVKRVVPVLIEKGHYPHPWLGAVGYDITPRLARLLRLPVDKGLLVARVYANGPAARAGLRGATRQVIIGNTLLLIGGDIITAVDGQPVKSWDELEDYLELEKQVGDTVTLTVIRDGRTIEIKVVLEEAPRGV